MSNIFGGLTIYAQKWEVKDEVALDAEDKALFSSARVVSSDFGKSVCFLFVNGKRYIPLEPTADVAIGDTLAVDKLKIVALNYTGTNVNQKVTSILRIRVEKDEPAEATFDNPFGL